MSRRSVTTVRIQVEMRLPPGAKPAQAIEHLKTALHEEYADKGIIKDLDLNAVQIKLLSKSTVYL